MSAESNSIQIFKHRQFGEIRSIIKDKEGKPWFVAKDVAEALGYNDSDQAVRKHCKKTESCPVDMTGQVRHMKIIPEADVYRLVMRSKLPQAEAFQDWVVEEVLPAIRKKGFYGAPQIEDIVKKAKADAIREYHNLSEDLRDLGMDVFSFVNKHRTVLSVLVTDGEDAQTTIQPEQTVSVKVTGSATHTELPNPDTALTVLDTPQELIKSIGLNEAVVLHQLHRMAIEEKRNWVKITYAEWHQKFPYKSTETLRRTIRSLEEKGIIKAEKQFVNFVRSKAYSINYDVLENLVGSQVFRG